MELVKITFLALAYTISIATIIVQLLCFRKKIEYKETIFLSLSFLLLILSVTISELYEISGKAPGRLLETSFYVFYVLVGVTTPVNIHTERIVKDARKKNRLVICSAIALTLLLFVGYFLQVEGFMKIVVLVFLNISILYSMIVVSKAKPSLLVLHKEKIEKQTALIFMIFLPLYAVIIVLDYFFSFYSGSLLNQAIIISLIVIFLALTKLLDDFKRLSLFTPQNTCNTDKLTYYNITNRELEVINLLIKGETYKDIGKKLFISIPTVKTHVSNIYQKMNINNKVELINLINN
jgi:DNA-binding CsgD family transcriptional regulator